MSEMPPLNEKQKEFLAKAEAEFKKAKTVDELMEKINKMMEEAKKLNDPRLFYELGGVTVPHYQRLQRKDEEKGPVVRVRHPIR